MAETETLSAEVTAVDAAAVKKSRDKDGQSGGGVPSSQLTEALEKLEKEQQEQELSGDRREEEEDMAEDIPDNDADTSREQMDYANGKGNFGKQRSKGKNRRKRAGKHHPNPKKSWRPYSKLSWEERRKVDEKETARATRKRDERFKSGLPMAPYNTTQFIMDDQDQPSPVVPEDHNQNKDRDRNSRDGRDDASGSYDSSDGEFYDSPSDEDTFLEKEFSEAYESFHAERLQQLSKEELVKEYIELETKNENLEKQIKEVRNGSRNSSDRDSRLPSEESVNITQVSGLEEEIQKLKEENAKLSRENEFLRAAAGKLTS